MTSTPFTKIQDRHASYIKIPLKDQASIKAAIIEKHGSAKGFLKANPVMKESQFSAALRGEARICPKKLAKVKQVLGMEVSQ